MLKCRRKNESWVDIRKRLILELNTNLSRNSKKHHIRNKDRNIKKILLVKDFNKDGLFSLVFRSLGKKTAKYPKIRKRKNELRNISAGDFVRFQMEIKLALAGEKMDMDWIFSN